MNFDFPALNRELQQLREYGIQSQRVGTLIVKLAESGLANSVAAQDAFSLATGAAAASSELSRSLAGFLATGNATLDAVRRANEGLRADIPRVEVHSFTALAGVTFSNIATQDLIDTGLDEAPRELRPKFVALAQNMLKRVFTEEELDNLLREFRSDLPERRKGAWSAYYSASEDGLAQAAHSMRDVLSAVVAKCATNEAVVRCSWYPPDQLKPSMTDRVRFLLFDADTTLSAEELSAAIARVKVFTEHDSDLKKIAHGSRSLDRDQVRLGMQETEELLFLALSRLNAKSA